MKKFIGFEHGLGIGGWLTNYKRFNLLPNEQRMDLTIGDFEHFDSFITEKDVKNIQSFGADHIRLGFDQIVLEESPYVYRERIFKLLDSFIGWCKKYKINLVLNLHKALGNYCDVSSPVSLFDDEELKNRFIKIWEVIEERYNDNNHIIFELLNEVRDVAPDKWNNLAGSTIAAIRALNPTRKIIIGGTRGNDVHTLKNIRIFDDENVIYTFHMYDPYEFTHQKGVLQPPLCYYNRDMPYPCEIERYKDYRKTVCHSDDFYQNYERMDKKFIFDFLQPASTFIKENPDKILWCGEFGTIRHCKTEWRENWFGDVIAFLKRYEIPYCLWNYLSTLNDGNKFSLVKDEDRTIISRKFIEFIKG